MTFDAKKVVASGYDQIAEDYLRWTSGSSLRQRWLDTIIPMLPPGARVLDLGCGAGDPVATILADHGCAVVGVDGSTRQIMLARQTEPRATFAVADMTTVSFDAMSFDAVTAFYSITHVPRDEHRALFGRIRGWLKPGGVFLASLGCNDSPGWLGQWLGAPMFFSHFDAAANRTLLEEADFDIARADIIGEEENGEIVNFLWVLARRR